MVLFYLFLTLDGNLHFIKKDESPWGRGELGWPLEFLYYLSGKKNV
jgi:hypothetical protein